VTPEVLDLAHSLMAALNCPLSLSVSKLIENEHWDTLKGLSVDPSDYCDAHDYFKAVQAVDFLRKYEGLPVTEDLEQAAFEKWLANEHACKKTNLMIQELAFDDRLTSDLIPAHVREVISLARKEVLRILGWRPPSDLKIAFGPGATMSDIYPYFTVPDKMSSHPTFTREAWPYRDDWSSTRWAKASEVCGKYPREIRGNKYFTVAKDSRSRRSCAKEPSLNSVYQLALGRAMRRRLRDVGIDLDSLPDEHKLMARVASVGGRAVTIDLSSASDTVARLLVKLLLPPLWFTYLDSARSPLTFVKTKTEGKGRWYHLEKFSSMGNGFTFELETIIFRALCVASCDLVGVRGEVSVFGDDIIVPTDASSCVLAVLRFFGFTPNPKKTYVSGVFRESCGGDFFNGTGVRPYQMKEEPYEPQHWISIANGIRRVIDTLRGDACEPGLLRVWFQVLDKVPSQIRRCRGPSDLGDIVIHDDPLRWTCRWRSSIRYLQVYRPCKYQKVWFYRFAPEIQYAALLYGVTLSGPFQKKGWGDHIVPRDGVISYKVGWTPFS